MVINNRMIALFTALFMVVTLAAPAVSAAELPDCHKEHDGSCGYVAEVGAECSHTCEICNPSESSIQANDISTEEDTDAPTEVESTEEDADAPTEEECSGEEEDIPDEEESTEEETAAPTGEDASAKVEPTDGEAEVPADKAQAPVKKSKKSLMPLSAVPTNTYTLVIPEQVTAGSGYSALSGGIKVTGDVDNDKTVTVKAESENNWYLVNGDKKVKYDLRLKDSSTGSDTFEFDSAAVNSEAAKEAGVYVAPTDYNNAESGNYSDVITFTASMS